MVFRFSQQHHRAALESQLHRSRANHRRGDRWRRASRRLLRNCRRAARHGAQSSFPVAHPDRHGAAHLLRRRRRPRQTSRNPARHPAPHARGSSAPTWCAGSTAKARSTAKASPAIATSRMSRPQSNTETFVALKLQIDNWRWADVPFYLRTGKRLAKRVTEIVIQFRRTPFVLFRNTTRQKSRDQPPGHPHPAGRRHFAAALARKFPAPS